LGYNEQYKKIKAKFEEVGVKSSVVTQSSRKIAAEVSLVFGKSPNRKSQESQDSNDIAGNV
jgi:hypothetical protein